MKGMEQPSSSIDRFLRNRAPAFIGLGGTRASIALNGALGGLFTFIGAGFIIGSIIAGEPGAAFGAIGPFIAGGVNLAVAGFTRMRASELDMTSVKLTDDAKRFLQRLMRHAFGWRYQWIGWESHRYQSGIGLRGRRLRRSFSSPWDSTLVQRPSSELLQPEVFAAFEEAANHYNRIYGLLVTSESSGVATLKKMGRTVMQAADETMAEIIHHAALMDKYPESDAVSGAAVARLTESLKEAADRVESLRSRESTAAALSPATAMDAVLDELRLQDMAGAELQAAVEERQPDGLPQEVRRDLGH
jgi:hypothetical protein